MLKPAAVLAGLLLLLTSAWASGKEQVLVNFGNGGPALPQGNNLIWGSSDIIYGTTTEGGSQGDGDVFKLTPKGLTEIHTFGMAGDDGVFPTGSLLLDAKGNLYGVTTSGGVNNSGMVFELSPQPNGRWNETIVYAFGAQGSGDGFIPNNGLIMDAAGNLYGTTSQGGTVNDGIVFELSPSAGSWSETILHSFSGTDGAAPNTLILDKSGNFYGSTGVGGNGACQGGCGTVFYLQSVNGQWQVQTLFSFDGSNGQGVTPGMVMDASGNFYGTAFAGGTNNYGTVWELLYSASQSSYTIDVLYNFAGLASGDGTYPEAGVTFGPGGSLYGTTQDGGSTACGWNAGCGIVFRLTKTATGWTKQSYEFVTANGGYLLYGNVIEDQNGNAYGMTLYGGSVGGGVLFRIEP